MIRIGYERQVLGRTIEIAYAPKNGLEVDLR